MLLASKVANSVTDTFVMANPSPYHVVFVHAPADTYLDNDLGGKFAGPRFPPIWAYTLAPYLAKDGRYALQLVDLRFDRIADIEHADLFLFTGLNEDLSSVLRAREEARQRFPNAIFVLGGPICASFDRSGDLERLAAFDHICIGDGEVLIEPVVEAIREGRELPHVVRAAKRFAFDTALPIDHELASKHLHGYFGAIVEVSRGCPFLCEFCDVRIAPDNNRPHNRNIESIIADLDALSRRGAKRFQLVCDDIIGDTRWAEQLMDRIIEWEDRTGFRPALYSWATLNLYKYPVLMRKMRQAGVDMLNVGVESFDRSALLETAKIQNMPGYRDAEEAAGKPNATTVEAVREIQSYGLVVAAGLIFGFDSDTPASFDIALDGIREAGVLTGDPHLLTALPGTPLSRRMKLAGRIRQVKNSGLGIRYQTNIRYLQPRDTLIEGMMHFFRVYSSGPYQLARLRQYFDGLNPDHFVPLRTVYLGPGEILSTLVRNRRASRDYAWRAMIFASDPRNLYYAARGIFMVASRRHIKGRFGPLMLWLLMWMNSVVKSRRMEPADFDIEDIGGAPAREQLLPDTYVTSADEEIPASKIQAQQRFTTAALAALQERLARSNSLR
jgi:radical SAM superfamily enzyme YgiQ (UPF0313 family)